jgi:hypothetical protein
MWVATQHPTVAKSVKAPDPVYAEIERIAQEYDYTKKEALRHMVREAGYDV